MISAKGRYALRVMVHLGEQNRAVPLTEIAERQEISLTYLQVITNLLLDAGFITREGDGFRLTRLPEEYTAGEILEKAEGTLSMVACLSPDAEPCKRAAECRTLPMWQRFNNVVHEFFYGITLKDLMQESCFVNNMLM
ncbi:MAG: Rrf2 family transcriptional regulator [Clostridia bacterium]|nr:Rrf2 family transcriptional regulator [Clostridia bacterium]